MSRRTAYRRRRRRGRFSAFRKFVCTLLILGAVVVAITLFFRTEKIEITGNERYSEEEILAASGLELGGNLFLMDKYDVAQRIFENLPYVEETLIHRALPDTIRLEVRECRAAAAIRSGEEWWLMSARGMLLEGTKTLSDLCPTVTGLTVEEPVPSTPASFGEEGNAMKRDALIAFLTAAQEKGVLANVTRIDASSASVIRFEYLNRFTVKIPWTADFSYKCSSLLTVADYLEVNETGTIDLTTDGKASFVPK